MVSAEVLGEVQDGGNGDMRREMKDLEVWHQGEEKIQLDWQI